MKDGKDKAADGHEHREADPEVPREYGQVECPVLGLALKRRERK